jgi:hypothetical protein
MTSLWVMPVNYPRDGDLTLCVSRDLPHTNEITRSIRDELVAAICVGAREVLDRTKDSQFKLVFGEDLDNGAGLRQMHVLVGRDVPFDLLRDIAKGDLLCILKYLRRQEENKQ